jgi:hypothetical protein
LISAEGEYRTDYRPNEWGSISKKGTIICLFATTSSVLVGFSGYCGTLECEFYRLFPATVEVKNVLLISTPPYSGKFIFIFYR